MSYRTAFTQSGQPSYTFKPDLASANNGLALVYDSASNQVTTSAAPVSGQAGIGPTLTFTPDGAGSTQFNDVATQQSTQILSDGTRRTTLTVARGTNGQGPTGSGFTITCPLAAYPNNPPKFPTSTAGIVYGVTYLSGPVITGTPRVLALVKSSADGNSIILESQSDLTGSTLAFEAFSITYDSNVVP